MTKHTIHDGVIKAMHDYDKHSAKHSALETIHYIIQFEIKLHLDVIMTSGFSGFFKFCVYTRSPVAGKSVKMLHDARGIVPHKQSMLVSTYTLHCTHPTP